MTHPGRSMPLPADGGRRREANAKAAATPRSGSKLSSVPGFPASIERLELRAAKSRHVVESMGGASRAAALIGVSKSQTSRWASGESQPTGERAKLVLDLDYVLSRVGLVWGGGAALDWIGSPNAFLGGARPLDVLRERGPAEVIEALDEESSGAFA